MTRLHDGTLAGAIAYAEAVDAKWRAIEDAAEHDRLMREPHYRDAYVVGYATGYAEELFRLRGLPGIGGAVEDDSDGDGDTVRQDFAAMARLGAEFWSTPELGHVYAAARHSRVSPEAVLICALARVVTAMPHHVVLPAPSNGAGMPQSRALYGALVATSGGSKNSADAMVDAILDIRRPGKAGREAYVTRTGLVTGQGVAANFRNRTAGKNGVPGALYSVGTEALVWADELTTLTAAMASAANDPTGPLCSAWSASEMAARTKDSGRWLPLAKYSYQLSVLVGCQPQAMADLIGKAGIGLPQRFVMVNCARLPEDAFNGADDPDRETLHNLTWPAVDKRTWQPPTWQGVTPAMVQEIPDWPTEGDVFASADGTPIKESFKTYAMPVEPEVDRGVRKWMDDAANGVLSPLQSQAPALRLRLAGALAMFHGRMTVTADDWSRACDLADASDGILTYCAGFLQRSEQEEAVKAGRLRMMANAVVQGDGAIASRIFAKVKEAGPDGMTGKEIAGLFDSSKRAAARVVLAQMVAADVLTKWESFPSGATRYRV